MDRMRHACFVVALLAMGAGCATSSPVQPPGLITVTVGMGFHQSVQFAPFYVALQRGYYEAAGLKVNFNYSTEPTALTLLANGKADFVDAGGDDVLTAAANGMRVKYVMTQYSRFPSALFFLKSRGFRHVSDLKGMTIGIPGPYGASYSGLLALLGANHMSANDVKIKTINYTQLPAVSSGAVDAAMGYAPNEPQELTAQGKPSAEFDVYKWANLAGAGIATRNTMIADNPRVVRAFVQATLKGLRFTIAHPSRAFGYANQSIPALADPVLQQTILNRAIDFWKPAGVPLGQADPKVWNLTEKTLLKFKQIPKAVKASDYYTNQFVK